MPLVNTAVKPILAPRCHFDPLIVSLDLGDLSLTTLTLLSPFAFLRFLSSALFLQVSLLFSSVPVVHPVLCSRKGIFTLFCNNTTKYPDRFQRPLAVQIWTVLLEFIPRSSAGHMQPGCQLYTNVSDNPCEDINTPSCVDSFWHVISWTSLCEPERRYSPALLTFFVGPLFHRIL